MADLAEDIVAPCFIVPGVICAGADVVLDTEYIAEQNITHYIAMDNQTISGLKGLTVDVLDGGDLLSHLSSSCEFIHQARLDKGVVLVFCPNGISRAPAVLTAYLMSHLNQSVSEALGNVRVCRPSASPHASFIEQLGVFQSERMGVAAIHSRLLSMSKDSQLQDIDQLFLKEHKDAWMDDWAGERMRTLSLLPSGSAAANKDQAFIKSFAKIEDPWDNVRTRGRTMSTLVVDKHGNKDIPLPEGYELPACPPPPRRN